MRPLISLLLLIVLLSSTGCHPISAPAIHEVSVRDVTYQVEIADTDLSRAIGLMNRTHLNRNAGMLFVFDAPDYYAFYMKNTFISLDILWIQANGQIGYIATHTRPEDETDLVPTAPAQWVLEINAGEVSKNSIQVGDTVTIR